MAYNPNEPRDAEGKWTDAGAAIRAAASDNKTRLKTYPDGSVYDLAKPIKIIRPGTDIDGKIGHLTGNYLISRGISSQPERITLFEIKYDGNKIVHLGKEHFKQ